MKISPIVERIRKKWVSRFDEEPDSWITVNGNHIPIDEDKKPIGGQMKAVGQSESGGSSGGRVEQTKHNYKASVLKEYDRIAPKSTIDVSTPTLKNWQSCADEYMENAVEQGGKVWGLTPEELSTVRDKFQGMLNNGDFMCGINASILDSVIEKGLLNIFEANRSNGTYDKDARRKLSENLFGAKDIEDKDREKYGFIADRHDYKYIFGDSAPGYGYDPLKGVECCVVLNDDIANRTTYTVEDSLEACDDAGHRWHASGAVNTHCSIEGLSYSTDLPRAILDGEVTQLGDIPDKGLGSYVECQFHGAVKPSDISEIQFRNYSEMKDAVSKLSDASVSGLKKNKIKVGYYLNEDDIRYADLDKVRGS